mmetsp:Transcript_6455/g.27514  ORF Transcript_6455/g.27514 Transcript_6455/m.27514 type:complete len:233 (+) Transcript_6455:2137-2835(+)
MRSLLPIMRPQYGKSSTPKIAARLMRYGKSKFTMLYPMSKSGSVLRKNFPHDRNSSRSSEKHSTSDPTMGAHVSRVQMARITGLSSPWHVTMVAIWITGSCSASGKCPLRPAHSMSTDKMRNGASLLYWPSGACDTTASYLTSHSYWHMDCFFSRCAYPPAGSSTQFPPTTPRSTMNRSVYSTLLSNVWKHSAVWCRPGTCRPCFSRMPRAVATWFGSVHVILTKVLVFPSW